MPAGPARPGAPGSPHRDPTPASPQPQSVWRLCQGSRLEPRVTTGRLGAQATEVNRLLPGLRLGRPARWAGISEGFLGVRGMVGRWK